MSKDVVAFYMQISINVKVRTEECKKKMAEEKKNKTKLIVVKDYGNRGKTTLIWMVLLELINKRGATKNWCTYISNNEEMAIPESLPPYEERWDFKADLLWENLHIVIISHGDTYEKVDRMLQEALQTQPDYIICAANMKHWGFYTWQLFEAKYTNIDYDRVCFWSERAQNKNDEELVKRPTVEAIIKYIS